MNKELELLNSIITTSPHGIYKIIDLSEKDNKEKYELLIQLLTPPTSEEVCKALSEYFCEEIYYSKHTKSFYEKVKFYEELDKVIVNYLGNLDVALIKTYLPPHIITMVGRFYEGNVANVKN